MQDRCTESLKKGCPKLRETSLRDSVALLFLIWCSGGRHNTRKTKRTRAPFCKRRLVVITLPSLRHRHQHYLPLHQCIFAVTASPDSDLRSLIDEGDVKERESIVCAL